MRRLPKLVEVWEDGNTTIEIYEDVQTKPSCELTCYKLRIISEDPRQFPVVSGAVNEAKRILRRKNYGELREIVTDFYLSGKEYETDQ